MIITFLALWAWLWIGLLVASAFGQAASLGGEGEALDH